MMKSLAWPLCMQAINFVHKEATWPCHRLRIAVPVQLIFTPGEAGVPNFSKCTAQVVATDESVKVCVQMGFKTGVTGIW
jgi:hypothetical protein